MTRAPAVLALVTGAYGDRGGIAQYNRDLLDALAGAINPGRIDVIARSSSSPTGVLPANVRQSAVAGGRLFYVVRACLHTLQRRPDVVFCGHINLAPLAGFLAKVSGAKLVVQLHGIEAWETPPPPHRRVAETADLVLCVSRYTRARLLSWAVIPPERAVVIPNTVRDDYHPADAEAARARFGLTGRKALLSVGRLDAGERYKGHDRIIERLPAVRAHIGDVVYLIAGDGGDRPRLTALAETFGVAEHVRFLGQLPDRELPDLYRAADLFVLPSTGEGFGIVFLEAMACGTPALGLAEKGALDALADGQLGDAVTEADLERVIVERLRRPKPPAEPLFQAVTARFGRPAFQRRVTAAICQLLPAGMRQGASEL